MAIYEQSRPVYKVFKKFLNRCIRNDHSLLWPSETAWTLQNVERLKERLIDSPVVGAESSFEEKLEQQMSGADAVLWKVISDEYFIYFLPSSYITLDKKLRDIELAAERGGFQAQLVNGDLRESLDAGFTRTSMKYHTKYAQFWLLTLFTLRVKASNAPDEILTDHLQMRSLLDGILMGIPTKADRAYDMRHAILHMSFPEEYEPIISTRDKERIVETYGSELATVPADVDDALREIRKILPTRRSDIDPGFNFYSEVREEWRPKKRPRKVEDEDVEEGKRAVGEPGSEYSPDRSPIIDSILATLSQTRNVILYGPPGTGKTYFAGKVARILAKPKSGVGVSEAVRLQELAESLTFYELLALGMFMEDPAERYSVPELEILPIIQARFAVSPVKHPRNQIWGYLQAHTSPESETVKIARRSEPYLFDKDDQSRWFLTEIGRSYAGSSIPRGIEMPARAAHGDLPKESFIEWVTFHQSYAYEEFIEGLRPVTSEDDPGEIKYEIEPGAFKRITTKALADPGNNYILVIDEINRGNIAKIFGELITLIEDDKRVGEPAELSVSLAYSPNRKFSVPGNLYIIGTMNTADRSIALLDVALRRRFAFHEIVPEPALLAGAIVESSDEAVDLEKLLRSLNQRIADSLDRDHQIGHSYFLKVRDADPEERPEILEHVWNRQVFPLLKEYFYSQPEELYEILSPMYPDTGLAEDAVQFGDVTVHLEELTGDDLLFALSSLAKV